MLDPDLQRYIDDAVAARVDAFASFMPRNSQTPPLATATVPGIVQTEFSEALPVTLNAASYLRMQINVDQVVPVAASLFPLQSVVAPGLWIARWSALIVGAVGDAAGVNVRMSINNVGPGGVSRYLGTAGVSYQSPANQPWGTAPVPSLGTFDKSAGFWLSCESAGTMLVLGGKMIVAVDNLSAANPITVKARSFLEAIRVT